MARNVCCLELKLSGFAARSSYRVVSRLGSQVSRQIRQISILAVLLMLCLGLPRFLVVCSGPHCHGSIEFVHASGSCCQDHHEVEVGCGAHEQDHGDDDGGDCGEGDAAEPSRCGCTDVAFSIAEGPLPERITFEFHDARRLTSSIRGSPIRRVRNPTRCCRLRLVRRERTNAPSCWLRPFC